MGNAQAGVLAPSIFHLHKELRKEIQVINNSTDKNQNDLLPRGP